MIEDLTVGSGLRFTFVVDELPPSTFAVIKFEGIEALSDPFKFEIDLASSKHNVSPDSVVDRTATLTVWLDGVMQQQWQGIISRFGEGDTGHHNTFYFVDFVPPLSRLTLRQNSRIFQQKTIPEIITIILQDMGVLNYQFILVRQYQQREYCVQYNESDLDFVQRIAAEVGICFHFSSIENKNTVIFTDDVQTFSAYPETILYNSRSGGSTGLPCVRQFIRHTRIRQTSVQLQDYNFEKPAYRFMQSEIKNRPYQNNNYDHFHYPSFNRDDRDMKTCATVHLESLGSDAQTAGAISNISSIVAGIKFTLDGHDDEGCNLEWTVIHVKHTGTQPQAVEGTISDGVTAYHNAFVASQGDRQWRPLKRPKPTIDGVSIATVVAPENEEIYCDEFGRVKIFFPWDHYGSNNDLASCWVRVSQSWAGGQYGSMILPRVGHEVLVSYIEGDIDRPIITGQTYNAIHQPPYPLPANKTRTVLRTQTHQGEGYNELFFEDQKGQEEISIHAQKDMNVMVKNDRADHIKNNLHVAVENDRLTHITTNDYLTVDGECRIHSKGAHTLVTDGALHLKAAQNIVIESGSGITLKVGGSFIKIDASGVSLVGPALNLNSGGSPDSGSGATPVLPKMLKPSEVIEDVQIQKIEPLKQSSEALLKEGVKEEVLLSSKFGVSG